MKTRAPKIISRPLAVLAAWLGLFMVAPVHAAFVYETPGEFLTAGDFNGDGLADALVLDKTTGNARVGYADGNGNLTWSAPLMTGVDEVSGCAAGWFRVATHDVLAVTAASLNRVQLYDLSGTNASVSLGNSTESGVGPHALASLASPFGSPPPPFSTLLVASSLNDTPDERLDLVTNFPIDFASSAGQFPETGSFERANALPIWTNGPTFAAGLVRGATNDTLHLWQFANSPSVILAFSNLPPGSDYVFGNFNGEPLPRFIFFQPGGTNLAIYPLLQTNAGFTFGPVTSVSAAAPVRQIFYLQLGADGSAMLVFSDGVQGMRLPGGVPSFSAKYTSGAGAAGNVFTGLAPLANGQFALFDGPAGSAASAHEQVIQFDGTNFTQRSAANLPGVSARNMRADVWLFQREPLVNRDPGFIASTIGYDWDLTETNLIFDWSCWLWTIAIGGGTGTILSLPSPDCYDDAPAVNPVDGRLAFHNLNPNLSGLYVTTPDRTSKQRLNLGVPGASWPAWSPDGDWLVFVDGNSLATAFSADGGTNLWVVRPDGTDLNQLSGFTDGTSRFPHGAIWTPDNSA